MRINTIFLSYIIQQVSAVSLTITRVSYKNINNIQTIAQNVWRKPPDVIVNNLGTPFNH